MVYITRILHKNTCYLFYFIPHYAKQEKHYIFFLIGKLFLDLVELDFDMSDFQTQDCQNYLKRLQAGKRHALLCFLCSLKNLVSRWMEKKIQNSMYFDHLEDYCHLYDDKRELSLVDTFLSFELV